MRPTVLQLAVNEGMLRPQQYYTANIACPGTSIRTPKLGAAVWAKFDTGKRHHDRKPSAVLTVIEREVIPRALDKTIACDLLIK